MFPIPKTQDMLIEIDKLGFDGVEIIANYATVTVTALQKSTRVYVRNTSNTIETALFGLVDAIKMFNSFPEKTRDTIQRQQLEEWEERKRLIDNMNQAGLARIKERL